MWHFIPTLALHAGIWSNLGLHKSCVCCHHHCKFIRSDSLLGLGHNVTQSFWLLQFFWHLFYSDSWASGEGNVGHLLQLWCSAVSTFLLLYFMCICTWHPSTCVKKKRVTYGNKFYPSMYFSGDWANGAQLGDNCLSPLNLYQDILLATSAKNCVLCYYLHLGKFKISLLIMIYC